LTTTSGKCRELWESLETTTTATARIRKEIPNTNQRELGISNEKKKDPNAMDVDALTLEKRNEMMRKGLCFNCEEQGHLSKDCPKKKKVSTSQTSPSYSPPKKPPPKELAAYIRAMTAQYNDDEKNNFYDDVEQEGF
jgi:Zinc knuckle